MASCSKHSHGNSENIEPLLEEEPGRGFIIQVVSVRPQSSIVGGINRDGGYPDEKRCQKTPKQIISLGGLIVEAQIRMISFIAW